MNKPRDIRLPALILGVVAIFALGTAVRLISDSAVDRSASSTTVQRRAEQTAIRRPPTHEIAVHFREGVAALQANQYENAVTAWRRVLELAPKLPEAHVNMGFAQLELGFIDAAAAHFGSALDLRGRQANAYYGLAVALERRCDIAGAIGAMRTFIHLTQPDDPFIRKAEAALWEWRAAAGSRPDQCADAAPLSAP